MRKGRKYDGRKGLTSESKRLPVTISPASPLRPSKRYCSADIRRCSPPEEQLRPLSTPLERGTETAHCDSSSHTTASTRENQDFCDECYEVGDLICCDNCVRSFHGVCLGLEHNQLPVVWVCPECVSSRGSLDCELEKQDCRLSTHEDSPLCREAIPKTPRPSGVDDVPNGQSNGDLGTYAQHALPNRFSRSHSSDCPRDIDSGPQQVEKEPGTSSAGALLPTYTAPGISQGNFTGLQNEDESEAFLACDRSLEDLPEQKAIEHSPAHALTDCDGTPQGEGIPRKANGETARPRDGVQAPRVGSLHTKQVSLDARDQRSDRDTASLPGIPTPPSVDCPIRTESHEVPRIVSGTIEELLRNGNFEHCLPVDMIRADLYGLDEVTETIASVWKQYTIRPPVTIVANSCFTSAEPTVEDLWRAGFSAKGSKVFVNGEENGRSDNFALAFFQLFRPNKRCPISVIGIQPSKTALSSEYMVPASLATYVTAHSQRDVIYNLTPTYSFVDLHIDYGADGISKTMGDCEKYWFLFPPTKRNLDLLASVHGEQGKLRKLLNRLECGIIAKTRSSEALYIPAGCIHATYTTTGGFLVAKDFVTTRTYQYIALLMQSKYFKVFDFESRELCLKWFMISLEVATQYQPVLAVCEVWVASEGVLRSLAPKLLLRILRSAKDCFGEALEEADHTVTQCPCGWKRKRCTFKSHWQETHLNLGHE